MGDLWDDLAVTQKERQQLTDSVQAIKDSCAKEHNKKHFGECPECWPRLINTIRDRYLNSSTKEWFSGRRLFLQELDTLFTQALAQKVGIAAIEQRIEDEKKEWYRDKLKSLGLVSAAKNSEQTKALQNLLSDRDMPVDDLIPALRSTISDGPIANQEAFDVFADRLKAAKTPQDKTDVYVDMFFQPQHDPEGAAKSQKYIEMLRNGAPLSDVINTMLRDRQANKGVQEQKLALQKQIEELRRAKAAHESDKAKKAKIRQDKADAAAAAEQQYKLPPCDSCGRPGNDQGYSACNYCLALSEVYHIPDRPMTIFCSDECWDNGAVKHDREAHSCASGSGCILLQEGEDVDMDQHNRTRGFCQECVLDHQIESIFCSLQCLDANFQKHREDVHIPKRDGAGQIGEDEVDLEYASEDKTKYRARKIESHWTPLDDALKEFTQKTGARRKDDPEAKPSDI
ncbi:hypothetical protein JX266_002738 [Neoarthrinium moseri]|nr:hypothetical protein JX266_002738 [Neoarthrinium moseri]